MSKAFWKLRYITSMGVFFPQVFINIVQRYFLVILSEKWITFGTFTPSRALLSVTESVNILSKMLTILNVFLMQL